jgi:hypothetical protein
MGWPRINFCATCASGLAKRTWSSRGSQLGDCANAVSGHAAALKNTAAAKDFATRSTHLRFLK